MEVKIVWFVGVVMVVGGGVCIRVMMWLLLFILASLGSQLFFTDSDLVRFSKFSCKMGMYIANQSPLTWTVLEIYSIPSQMTFLAVIYLRYCSKENR